MIFKLKKEINKTDDFFILSSKCRVTSLLSRVHSYVFVASQLETSLHSIPKITVWMKIGFVDLFFTLNVPVQVYEFPP